MDVVGPPSHCEPDDEGPAVAVDLLFRVSLVTVIVQRVSTPFILACVSGNMELVAWLAEECKVDMFEIADEVCLRKYANNVCVHVVCCH